MSKRKFYFVVVLIFALTGENFAQTKKENIQNNIFMSFAVNHLDIKKVMQNGQDNSFRISPSFNSSLVPGSSYNLAKAKFFPSSTIAADYYTNQLGFVCRKEWQLEKLTSVPFRFRLGSLAYTDYLEGKSDLFTR